MKIKRKQKRAQVPENLRPCATFFPYMPPIQRLYPTTTPYLYPPPDLDPIIWGKYLVEKIETI